MDLITKELHKEKEKLENIINEAKRQLNEELKDVPDRSLRLYQVGNAYQIYYIDDWKKDKVGQYVKKEDRKEAVKIIQKNYCEKVICKGEKRINYINKVIGKFESTDIEDIYTKTADIRKNFIRPIVVDDENYIKEWLKVQYQGKKFQEDDPLIYTDKEERVRSKSEKIIADKLNKENIYYRYECPLYLRGMGKIYPDFTILDVRNRRNIFLEHLGMMDNQEYFENAMRKIEQYQLNGYVLGDNLFLTMETKTKPFNSMQLDGIVKKIKG